MGNNWKEMLKIYSGNALRSGLVVYLTQDFTWSENAKKAILVPIEDEDLIKICEREGWRARHANEIVEPYWANANDDGSLEHMRERMRAEGPTVRSYVIPLHPRRNIPNCN